MPTQEQKNIDTSEPVETTTDRKGGIVGALCREMADNRNVMSFSEMGEVALEGAVGGGVAGGNPALGALAGVAIKATTKVIGAAKDLSADTKVIESETPESRAMENEGENRSPSPAHTTKEGKDKGSESDHKWIEDPPNSGLFFEYIKEKSGMFRVIGPDGRVGYAHWLPQKWDQPKPTP